MPSDFQESVYSIAQKIPAGRVSTYKEIARGVHCCSPRAIGQALKRNPYPIKVPCHRVICSNGKVGGYKGRTTRAAKNEKLRLLRREGILIVNGNIQNLSEILFRF
ncbi:MGMT family protein [Candidatus Woesearchaeota archaeon]|nr:MGMT family protein [Candidatus Woesearchaeota archaeon]